MVNGLSNTFLRCGLLVIDIKSSTFLLILLFRLQHYFASCCLLILLDIPLSNNQTIGVFHLVVVLVVTSVLGCWLLVVFSKSSLQSSTIGCAVLRISSLKSLAVGGMVFELVLSAIWVYLDGLKILIESMDPHSKQY